MTGRSGPGAGSAAADLGRTRRWLARAWPIVAVVLAFVLGWVASSLAGGAAQSLRTGGEFTGVVTVVNYNGSKFCFTPDGDGQQRCSIPYQLAGADPLEVGDHIRVTEATLHEADRSVEVYVVTAPLPSPSG